MPSQEIVQTEENILVFDNIFSRGYGFSPQVLTRIPQLSIEAKGLYSYFSSFAGQGGVAFPSTSTILAEMNISKNRFYKYRSELEAWGFITVDIENTRHGRRTVYHLPVEPKPTDKVHELIDEATKARMHKVNNLPNAPHADSPTVDNLPAQQDCGKPDFVDKCSYTQTPGHEPRPQNEDLAYPRPQNEDYPCPQNEDMLNIVTSNKGKVTNDISRVAVDNRDQTGSESGAKAPIDTLASSLIDGLSEEEKKAFERLCTVSLKKPNAVRKHQAEKLFTRLMQQGYLPMQVISAYERYGTEYKKTNSTPRYAMQLDDWMRKETGFRFYADSPKARAESADAKQRSEQNNRQKLIEADPRFKEMCNRTTALFSDWRVAEIGGLSTANSYHDKWKQAVEAEKRYLTEHS